MPTFSVDPGWYERTWLTERPPSRALRLGRRARHAALKLSNGFAALAALF
jgi:hypothetical protein